MNFDESLEEIHIKNSILTASIRKIKINPNLNEEKVEEEEATFLNQIESIYLNLAQEWFQNELNENIFHIEDFTSFEFLVSLMENIVSYIEHFNQSEATIKKFQILKEISMLNITRFLRVKPSLLIRLLKFLEKSNFDASIVLAIVLELSTNQFLGKIDSDMGKDSFIDEFKSKFTEHSIILNKIKENLNKKSIETILLEFKQCYNKNDNVYDLIVKESFFDDMKFISLNVNANFNKNFYSELFTKYASFSLFERLLDHFLNKLFDTHSQKENNKFDESDDENENDEDVCRFLRDLLGIIHKGKFTDQFLNEKVLKLILKLYENINLVKYLFIRFNNVLALTVRIFYYYTMRIFYNINQKCLIYDADDENSFRILNKTRETIENLFQQETSRQKQEEDLLRLFIIALAFLQEKFKPKESLINFSHVKFLATKGYIQKVFKDVSNVFKHNSVLVKWQFRNEFDQEETQRVHRLNFVGDSLVKQFDKYRNFTLVDTINGLNVMCSTKERKLIVYEGFGNFFKSIIFYGVEVEKILCLKCLIEFCEIESIKSDLINDEKLLKYLLEIKSDYSNARLTPNAKRLNTMIENFFSLS